MNEDEMWNAVLTADARCDGQFFYAVASTGIFCRPSCKSKIPNRENVRYFDTAAQARLAGFRPCKRCRSDLPDYQPLRDTAQQAKAMLDEGFARQQVLHTELASLGVSTRRIGELFKTVYGVTPGEYMNGLRLHEAKRRLCETREPVIDIAYAIGFGGVSSFYRFFKKAAGCSPAAYRKANPPDMA